MQHSATLPGIYKSKSGAGLLIAITTILGIFTLLSLFLKAWVMLGICLLTFAFIAYMFLNTFYKIEGEKLVIKCGFTYFNQININSIKKITETNSALSAPALSLERLEIFYNRFDSVMISPQDKTGFIAQLTEINPEIEVKLYSK